MALGNVGASKALKDIYVALAKVARTAKTARDKAEVDPLASIRAGTEAKKAIADAEAAALRVKASGGFLPTNYANAVKDGARIVESLDSVLKHAAEMYEEIRQAEPEWTSPKHAFFPSDDPAREYAPDEMYDPMLDGFTGMRRRRRCRPCPRRRRRR